MQRMRKVVRDHNVYRWAAELISELSEIRLESPEGVQAVEAFPLVSEEVSLRDQEKAAQHQ
jgi:hypothetical protein